jgi:ADP-heptose:LPS heptosyltransferase
MGIPKESLLPLTFPSFHPEVNNIPLPSSAFILVHIGGGWEFKRWATEKWVNLVDSLSKDTPVVVISGPGEAGILSELSSKLSLPNSVTCKVTTFEEMIALTIGCSIFIGLDSGPMNLATCLNKKVVALFGPGEFNMWRPLTEGSRVVRRVERFPCSPCLQITCLYPHHNCMAEIQVEDVMNAIVQTLDSPGKQT